MSTTRMLLVPCTVGLMKFALSSSLKSASDALGAKIGRSGMLP
ncbi:MAG: hypothetical protein QOG67_1635 [Verrucomicrobiota bacterium]